GGPAPSASSETRRFARSRRTHAGRIRNRPGGPARRRFRRARACRRGSRGTAPGPWHGRAPSNPLPRVLGPPIAYLPARPVQSRLHGAFVEAGDLGNLLVG